MSFLTVRHSTVYRYSEPVGLGEHRMMFRPRESHDLRLDPDQSDDHPAARSLRWLHDPFDNSVAVATFEGTTWELRFESTVTLEHFENTCRNTRSKITPGRILSAIPTRISPISRAVWPSLPSAESVSKWALQFLDPRILPAP